MFRGLLGGPVCVGALIGPSDPDGVHGQCRSESGAGQGGGDAGGFGIHQRSDADSGPGSGGEGGAVAGFSHHAGTAGTGSADVHRGWHVGIMGGVPGESGPPGRGVDPYLVSSVCGAGGVDYSGVDCWRAGNSGVGGSRRLSLGGDGFRVFDGGLC